MASAKKRNLFEEISEGLESLRHSRDSLPQHELPALDVRPISEHPVLEKNARKKKYRRRVS